MQYDGVISQQKGFLGNILTPLTKEWKTHATECADIFSPLKKTLDVVELKESLEKFHSLMDGLKTVYFKDFRCWSSESEFKKKVRKTSDIYLNV